MASNVTGCAADNFKSRKTSSSVKLYYEMSSPVYLPPANLHKVVEGVYRSAYPEEENYAYLETLALKTVVTLVEEECPKFKSFLGANGITHHVLVMPSTKEGGVSTITVSKIMEVLLNPANYPLLIHCNQGKHRTGCIIGAMRKIKHWDVERVVDEYSTIAAPKIRQSDIKFLTDLDVSTLNHN